MSDVDDDQIEDSSAPLIEHLAELRNRLIRSVIALIIGIVLAFTVSEPILQFLLRPIEATLRDLGDPAPILQYTSPQEYLFTLFRISFVFGFGLAFPVISHQFSLCWVSAPAGGVGVCVAERVELSEVDVC